LLHLARPRKLQRNDPLLVDSYTQQPFLGRPEEHWAALAARWWKMPYIDQGTVCDAIS
jgi:hypothetical protein